MKKEVEDWLRGAVLFGRPVKFFGLFHFRLFGRNPKLEFPFHVTF
jgi:hypothetical protein